MSKITLHKEKTGFFSLGDGGEGGAACPRYWPPAQSDPGPLLCIAVDVSVPGGPRRGSCGFSKVLTTMFMAGTFIIHELHEDVLFSRVWSIDTYLVERCHEDLITLEKITVD